jgi:hypothetical protein
LKDRKPNPWNRRRHTCGGEDGIFAPTVGGDFLQQFIELNRTLQQVDDEFVAPVARDPSLRSE